VRRSDERLSGRSSGPGRAGYVDAPLVVTWETTRACDLACVHCRADACADRDPEELDTPTARALMRQVAGFGERPPAFVFTGGDPLKRPDLMELVRYGRSLGLPVGVTPASTPLLTRETVERLAEAGVRRMALSLDGSTAERHDGFRGEAGSFRTVLRAAAHARRAELPLQINTTVTAGTASDLPEIARRVTDLGAVMWEVFFLVPVGRGARLEPLGPDEHEEVLTWLCRHQREAPYRIVTVEAPFYRRVARQLRARERQTSSGRARPAGGRKARHRPTGSTGDANGFVFVSYRGEVFPSGFLPLSAGNVRTGDLVEIYRNSRLFRALRDRDRLGGKCGRCEFRFLCGGSRARAFAAHGDPLAEDPFCPYVPEGSPRLSGPGRQVRRRGGTAGTVAGVSFVRIRSSDPDDPEPAR